MKYTTKELLNMTDDEIIDICNNKCETSKCPFKPSLRKCRENVCCVVTTYKMIDKWISEVDNWISEDEGEIERLKDEIKEFEECIKKYKQWKKVFEKELENEEDN